MLERTFSFWRRLVGKKPESSLAMEEERRLWVRYPADLPTTVQPPESKPGLRLAARVRDISQGGASLLVDRSFQPGDMLSLELPRSDEAAPILVLACIVRVSPEKEGEWALGCVFSRELDNDDLEGFGARRVRPPNSDQRTWMRFPCDVKASCYKVGDPDEKKWPAQVLNLSPTGVGLAVSEPVDTGFILSVELLGTREVRTMLACVVHVSSHPQGGWSLGCNFIRELSEKDLQALVECP